MADNNVPRDVAQREGPTVTRRTFCSLLMGLLAYMGLGPSAVWSAPRLAAHRAPAERESIFSYIESVAGRFDETMYRAIIGAANDYKEGDELIGVAAVSEDIRRQSRLLLSNTRVGEIDGCPLFQDALYRHLQANLPGKEETRWSAMTLGELRDYILSHDEADIRPLFDVLSSDVIACLVKIMDNSQLIAVSGKIFNPLPDSMIGARGYLSARIQPNSPVDNPEDIFWQILSGWSFAVGDLILGVNPVSSAPESVAQLEAVLLDVRRTFRVEEIISHSVLAHIDVQAEVENLHPGTTCCWFQSLAGSDAANATFGLTYDKMLAYAARRTGQYGFYFETGQGSDFTNGHGQGTDMVIHESRKYGFIRLLKTKVAEAQAGAGHPRRPWVHVNDVAGFIGPEVFRSREQLVRCCLEDLVMGKLHGLTIGLDICSTLHMDLSLDDLDWCQDQIMPANPAYLMALPTKCDPMLGYVTTAYQDHVRLRQKFNLKINDAMERFFQNLGVLDAAGGPSARYGQPLWIWLTYCRLKGDNRSDADILAEGREKMQSVRARGVFLAEGYGDQPWDMAPSLDREIRNLFANAQRAIWAEFTPAFLAALPQSVRLRSASTDRKDYIYHPSSGEDLSPESRREVEHLAHQHKGASHVQILISDGLNAYALMNDGQLAAYLAALDSELAKQGLRSARPVLVLTSGRVRAGYRIGEILFGGPGTDNAPRTIIHLIGERPGGTIHNTFSAYITTAGRRAWSARGKIDHDITKVVSGIANSALAPSRAAVETVRLIGELSSNPAPL